MKKLLIIFLLLFLILPAMGEYIPIEKSKSREYKKEIIESINSQIPIRKKEILNVFNEVEKEQDPYEKNLIIEYGVDGVLFDFYNELIDITEKYTGKDNVSKNAIEGDSSGLLFEVLIPYLKDNRINTSKILLFIKFAQKEQKKLEKKFNYPITIH